MKLMKKHWVLATESILIDPITIAIIWNLNLVILFWAELQRLIHDKWRSVFNKLYLNVV